MGLTNYGMLAALAMAALLGVTSLAGRKRGVGYSSFIRFAVLALTLAFLCSRLLFCLCHPTLFMGEGKLPLVLHVQDGGYTLLGALLGVLLAGFVTEKWQKLPAGTILDAAAIGMPCALIIARLAEPLASMGMDQIGWGPDYASPLFAFLDEMCGGVHPVFAYEAIAAAGILFALLFIRRNARLGDTLLAFLLLFGCSQTVLESMLDTKHMMIAFLHITQLAAILMALLTLILWSIRYPRPDRGAKLRLSAAWALAGACIASALVQEISITGEDRVRAIAPFVPAVMGAGAAFWFVAWRKAGLMRLLPVVVACVAVIAAMIIDQTPLVGDHYQLTRWSIMALDMFLLCWTGLGLRTPAEQPNN